MPYFKYENHDIFYLESGTENENTLVFLPGNTASSVAHVKDIGKYEGRYHVLSLDFLGTGKSSRTDYHGSDWFDFCSRQVEALLCKAGCGKTILVGISGGGIIALKHAYNFPGKVEAVIADSCTDRFTREMYESEILIGRAARTPEQTAFWKSMHGDDWESVVGKDSEMLLNCVDSNMDIFQGRLPQIKCEVLLTFGKQDISIGNLPQLVGRMLDRIEKCTVFVDSAGEHPLIWTGGDVFYRQLEIFIGRIFRCG